MRKVIIGLLLISTNLAKASEQETSASKISSDNNQEYFLSEEEVKAELRDLEEELNSIPINKPGEEYLFSIMNKKDASSPTSIKKVRKYVRKMKWLENEIDKYTSGKYKPSSRTEFRKK